MKGSLSPFLSFCFLTNFMHMLYLNTATLQSETSGVGSHRLDNADLPVPFYD